MDFLNIAMMEISFCFRESALTSDVDLMTTDSCFDQIIKVIQLVILKYSKMFQVIQKTLHKGCGTVSIDSVPILIFLQCLRDKPRDLYLHHKSHQVLGGIGVVCDWCPICQFQVLQKYGVICLQHIQKCPRFFVSWLSVCLSKQWSFLPWTRTTSATTQEVITQVSPFLFLSKLTGTGHQFPVYIL